MIRFWEFIRPGNMKRMLIRLDSIKQIDEVDGEKDRCLLNGNMVKTSYEAAKKIIQSNDRVLVHDDSVDFRIRYLANAGGLSEIYANFKDFTVDFIKEILEADREDRLWEISKKYYDKVK